MLQLKLLKPKKPQTSLTSFLFILSFVLAVASFAILWLIYQPIVTQEIKYAVLKPKSESIKPNSYEFGIVIPKINVNAPVIKNIDSYQANVYQEALSRGVAHAKGTSLPGEVGNIFIFAHSSGNFYQASRYNSIFYLLHKLKSQDKIIIYFKNSQFTYKVINLEYVEPERIDYLSRYKDNEALTLMTCWPPGTTSKRLIVNAKRITN